MFIPSFSLRAIQQGGGGGGGGAKSKQLLIDTQRYTWVLDIRIRGFGLLKEWTRYTLPGKFRKLEKNVPEEKLKMYVLQFCLFM